MTIELEEVQTFTGEIANGASESLELETAPDHTLQVLLDDGSGGLPPAYDLHIEYYVPALDAWMAYTSVDNAESPSFEVDVRAARARVTITGVSGAAAQYRIAAQSFRDF